MEAEKDSDVTGVGFRVISSENVGSFSGLSLRARWDQARPTAEEARDETESYPRR